MPGVNAPKDAGPPTASASVAGTMPPTPPPAARASLELKNGTARATIWVLTASVSRPVRGTLAGVTVRPVAVSTRSVMPAKLANEQ